MESHAHALCDWGTRRLGHENTGNSPTFARRLAFMRGAARQFKAGIVDYQSCNLGDASTIFSRQSSFYPASSRYIIDNQYDAWAGAGVNWVLKDYLLFHLAGADAFYHEEGNDIFFKPGGNAAGDDFPIQLSPRGRVTQAVMKLFSSHPRGTQFTPVAFLLDEAHGWSQERFVPGSFGLDPLQNPAVLTPGRHEAAIRGWFDVAYFPAPETQNEPASAIRQTFVNGIFGDIFDVIVNAPDRSAIAKTYPVLIAAGEVPLTKQWGAALRDYMEAGGTLVTCDGSFSGDGAAEFQLGAQPKQLSEASSFDWKPAGKKIESNVFRYRALPTANAHVLATASDASAIVTATSRGKGRLVQIAVPLGLGIDDCPAPMLALVMQHVTQGLLPIHVRGDVEWTLNRLDDGGWVICLLNNRGVIKPEHGVLPTDYAEAQDVTIAAEFKLRDAREWITDKPLTTSNNKDDLTRITLTVPAGCARIIEMQPR
jgi:hypothetical protein